MRNNICLMKNEITPVRLHLELRDDNLSDYQKRMLKRYGESTSGEAITRDILIPSDMPLHNLHYTIQKLFGWQNSHLRRFYLPDEIYNKLTEKTVKGWSELVGILFQTPSEAEEDIFWDDDYQKDSFKVWLRKKYTGPYIYKGTMEHLEIAKKDINQFLKQFEIVEIEEPFRDYMERSKKDKNAERKIIKKVPLLDLSIEEMNLSIFIESGTESLLERLEVNNVLSAIDENKIAVSGIFPVTDELIYNYDFGDNWIVKITKYKNCEDLLEKNIIDQYELEEAENIVLSKHMPVCINKEGVSVVDDAGGLTGFADLLGTIYEDEDIKESEDARAWAKSLGWKDSKVSNKMML